jgi:hypothetical protein
LFQIFRINYPFVLAERYLRAARAAGRRHPRPCMIWRAEAPQPN